MSPAIVLTWRFAREMFKRDIVLDAGICIDGAVFPTSSSALLESAGEQEGAGTKAGRRRDPAAGVDDGGTHLAVAGVTAHQLFTPRAFAESA